MPIAERTATVVWQGEISSGSGRLETGSASLGLPISFPSRLETESDTTSPEELIAAAHASCYAMSLANTLHANGHRPESLQVRAVCRLARTEDGLRIQELELQARTRFDRLEQETFEQLAQKAEERCPVSQALKGSVSIILDARLDPE